MLYVLIVFQQISVNCNTRADCGDITDVAANDGVFGAESECTMPCPGDPLHLCGAGNRLNTYFWNGAMNDWHTPTNICRYEVRVYFLLSGEER